MLLAYPSDVKSFQSTESELRRHHLQKTIKTFGKDGPALLSNRWPSVATNALLIQAFLATASEQGWAIDPMTKDAVEVLRDPKAPKTRVWGDIRRMTIYFAMIDAAADPLVAELLLKTYPKDWTLYPTFARHLPKDKLIAWLEPIAAESAHPSNRGRIIGAWQTIGAEAIPSMERVKAAMAAKPETDKLAAEYAKAIREALKGMKP